MTDIQKAERRLIAALDRIDYSLDVAQKRGLAATDAGADQDGAVKDGAEVALLDADLADLHQRQARALDEARARLDAAGSEMARLSEANEALSAANRALIAAGDGAAAGHLDAARQALQAEVMALRAARAAEVAQMGDIMSSLEAALGLPPVHPHGRVIDVPRRDGADAGQHGSHDRETR